MKLVVGLGNPGKEYEKTRHNVGFMILDNYLKDEKWSTKFNGLYTEKTINNEKYIFLKPQSYINLSGGVVYRFYQFFKLSLSDILIIQDDLDLEIGKIRVKINSSSGGHNGIKDIISQLGSNEFARIKVGVSNNKNVDTKDYVLGKFSKEELNVLENNYQRINNIIEDFCNNNIDEIMNKYN